MSNFGDHPAGFFGDSSFYNGAISTSYRNDNASDAYLYGNKGGNGDRQTFTISWWMKIGTSLTGTIYTSGYSGSGGSASSGHIITSSNKVRMQNQVNNSAEWTLDSTRLFRDVSAWYNCVLAVDTTQGTEANRIKLYVNGVQETLSGSYPSQNANLRMNNQFEKIGTWDDGGSRYFDFDGYFADFNLIDGTQLDASSFGEFKNGVWIPVDTSSLTRGTKGWRLEFKQVGVGTASASTIGADTGGNDFHFTSSGIVASDCAMPDSPENNFATLNPLSFLTDNQLENGNLELDHEATSHRANTGTMFMQTGKWYFEVHNKTSGAGSTIAIGVGLQDITKLLSYASGANNYVYYVNNNFARFLVNESSTTLSTDGTHTVGAGGIIQVAYDADSGKIFIGLNNTYIAEDAGTDGNPATGANPTKTLSTSVDYIPFVGVYNNIAIANFGQDSSFAGNKTAQGNTDGNGIGDFYYAPPSGFLALCTDNLPEPTIGPNSSTQADDYFNTVLYSGNNDATRTFDVGFVSDFAWFKARNQAGYGHQLYDSSRGVTKRLYSNASNAESTNAEGVTSFDSSGNLAIGTDAFLNEDGTTMVIWNWKANGGTTTTNDASATGVGSIDSVYQANTTAGFSIVTYTGTGSAGTVGHGLGVAPTMIIFKNRSTTDNWIVYNKDNGNTNALFLNLTNANSTSNTFLNSTTPSSTVFNLATVTNNNGSGNSIVAYCFAEVEGYSKFGSYTGNAADDGTFVYLGFKPAWIMIKCSSATSTFTSWAMYDNKRKTFNDDVGDNSNPLYANQNAPEGERGNGTTDITGNAVALDFLSNGFKCRDNASEINASQTFIYMAFAEAPFKYSNAE